MKGYKEASIISYSTPANNNTKEHVVAKLPKPRKHESEVLLEKVVRELLEEDLCPRSSSLSCTRTGG